MLLFVAGWWCVDYYYMLLASPAIQIYLSNMALNPCFLDGEHMRQRQEILAASCAELRSLQANFTLASITIEDTLHEVQHFTRTCRCDYPEAALAETLFSCSQCDLQPDTPGGASQCCADGAQPPALLQKNVSRPLFAMNLAWCEQSQLRFRLCDAVRHGPRVAIYRQAYWSWRPFLDTTTVRPCKRERSAYSKFHVSWGSTAV